jgi:uncharacterized glyoxalase superfamily protein PhnB
MDQSYKPQGYSNVSAYIMADGAQRIIDFLVETFAAQKLRRYDNPDGSIMHVEVKIGDTVVMLAAAFPARFAARLLAVPADG